MEWRGGFWVGAVAVAGGVLMVVVVLVTSGDARTEHPADVARMAAFGIAIAVAGFYWISQSRRCAEVVRCKHCTIVFRDGVFVRPCPVCNAALHAECIDGHRSTYHQDAPYR